MVQASDPDDHSTRGDAVSESDLKQDLDSDMIILNDRVQSVAMYLATTERWRTLCS